jgi:hypothetical protein
MSIFTKLLEFQKLGISIKRDKTNPAFRSSYADINEVLDKVKPALSKVGITMVQLPQPDGLRTQIIDPEDGTMIEGFLPYMDTANSQKLGSSITYNRRYSLVAMLGLEDDDDDGNEASAPAKPAARAPAKPTPPPMNADRAIERLVAAKSLAELQAAWRSIPNGIQKDPEVLGMKDQRKHELTNQEDVIT